MLTILQSKNKVLYTPIPRGINSFWNIGRLLGALILLQLVTGIFLTIRFRSFNSFDSLINYSQSSEWGWWIRWTHANNASLLFMCIILHVRRGIFVGSFSTKPLAWLRGWVLLIGMIARAFLGYILPWGQISFWGVIVITNFISVFPNLGNKILSAVWGNFSVREVLIPRFLTLHFLIPLIMIVIIVFHMIRLHSTGRTLHLNKVRRSHSPSIAPFTPYFTWKDVDFIIGICTLLVFIVSNSPYAINDPENFIEGDPLVTPVHIKPEWYFLSFYAILRGFPSKTGGVILIVAAIAAVLLIVFIKSKDKTVLSGKIAQVYCISVLSLTTFGSISVDLASSAGRQYLTLIYFLSLLAF